MECRIDDALMMDRWDLDDDEGRRHRHVDAAWRADDGWLDVPVADHFETDQAGHRHQAALRLALGPS